MILLVAPQPASAFEYAEVFEFQSARNGVATDDSRIEIDQVAVCRGSALVRTDPVRIVAGRTRGLIFQMLAVSGKTLVV